MIKEDDFKPSHFFPTQVLQLKFSKSPPKTPSYNGLQVSDSDSDSDEDLENPETLNRTLSDIIEGKNTSRLSDLSFNTQLFGADSELTNGQLESSNIKECLSRENNLHSPTSPIVLVTQNSDPCSEEELTQCNGNSSEIFSDISANCSVENGDVAMETNSNSENLSTSNAKTNGDVKSETSLLDEISLSLQSVSLQNSETNAT